MSKLKIAGIVAAFALALPFTASALVEHTFLVVDGGPNTTVEVGDNVSAAVTFDTDGEDVESFSWRLVGSDLPAKCVNTVDVTNPDGGTYVRSFTMDLTTQGEGGWDVEIMSFGDNGANASNGCEALDENDSTTFGDRITIVDAINDNQQNDNDTNTNVGNDNDEELSELTTLILRMDCRWAGGTWNTTSFTCVMPVVTPPVVTPPVVVAPTKCATLNTKMVGTVENVYNPYNTVLQGYLIGEGMTIDWLTNPAKSAGVPFGYFGTQTRGALTLYKNLHGCV